MEYRRLGSSDLEVSAISFGAWQLGDADYWGDSARPEGNAAVAAAVDAGINLFDTAESYGGGESEKALGKALGARRKNVLIASKVGPDNCAPDKMRQSCEASLRRLGTDVIDLYQVHWPCAPELYEDAQAELLRLKQEGKIREIGISNFGASQMAAWTKTGMSVSNQLGYNLLFRAIEYDIVPTCQHHGMGILVYMPLLQGILSDKWATIDQIPTSRRRTRHFSSDREAVRHGEPGCEEISCALPGAPGEIPRREAPAHLRQWSSIHRQGLQGIHPIGGHDPRAYQPLLPAVQRQTGADAGQYQTRMHPREMPAHRPRGQASGGRVHRALQHTTSALGYRLRDSQGHA